MPIQDFLQSIHSSLSRGQKNLLQRFLSDAKSGKVIASVEDIQDALSQVSTLLPSPGLDVTDPNGFNVSVSTILANISGLYQEMDRLEATRNRLSDLNSTDLSRVEFGIKDLQTVLDSTNQANIANTQWTDVFYESFGSSVSQETSLEWYKPLPILAATGQVEAFLPLVIDPETHSLKLVTGGEFTRSTNSRGQPLAKVEIDEILGLSIDRNHGIDQVEDGKLDTYWRELIISDAPITADISQVPWLPQDYSGGAAARLHFRFPFAIPFTELSIRPFSRYPVQVIQLVWDNTKQSSVNFITNGNLASGSVGWTYSAASGTTVSFLSNGGYLNQPSIDINAVSGRTVLTNNIFGFTSVQPSIHLHFLVYRDESIVPQVFVNWYASGSTDIINTEWIPPSTPFLEWFEYSRLFLAPPNAASGQLIIAVDGSGDIKLSSIVFNQTIGQTNTVQTAQLESNILTVEMNNAIHSNSSAGTDVWVTLAQPHYDYIQLAIPEGEVNQQTIWQDVRLQTEAVGESLFQFQSTAWSLESGGITKPPDIVNEDGTNLSREARRVGGRIKDLVVSLLKFSKPSTRTITLNKYLYTLGAWEIVIKHHEYGPQGLFVTTPYHPRGEVREVNLQTDPPLSNLESRVRFWMTARASDKSDKAQIFTGRATFSSSTETPMAVAGTHFSLPPVSKRQIFTNTDRAGKVSLTFHPYKNRERIWEVNNAISSGSIANPVVFDPNKDSYLVEVGSTLTSVPGYRPIQVTLYFTDGTVAHPDILGKIQPGDIGFAGPEILTLAQSTQDLTTSNENPIEDNTVIGRIINFSSTKKQKRKTQTISQVAYQTQFSNIISGINGAPFSLYWHNPNRDTASGGIITTSDVLISPGKYTIDTTRGLLTVRATVPSGNTAYTQFVAYYYYKRDDLGVRQSTDSRDTSTTPTSGIDFVGGLNQQILATRNVTDYINGTIPTLRPAILDDLDLGFYPFYEYYEDGRGSLIFANILAPFGDREAQIQVDYESLLIEPRLLIEYAPGFINSFSTHTPTLNSYTLFMNSRK